MQRALVALVLLLAVSGVQSQGNCTFQGSGFALDFSSLTQAGGWVFDHVIGNDTWSFQVQVCQDVAPTLLPSCPPGGAVYMANKQNGTCWSLGSANLFSIDEVPSKNGAMLTYYHGSLKANNVQFLSARLYFECNPTAGAGKPDFEHGYPHDGPYTYMYHFMWATKLACKA